MKEKVLKTHGRSENHKTLKEEHPQMASNRDKSESDKNRSSKKSKSDGEYRSTKESSKKKNYRNEINFDESYEELSRKKRKIERELHALDLEEAAAKKQKIDKASKHQAVSNDDKNDEDKRFSSRKNRYERDRKISKHQNINEKDKPPTEENRWLTSERNKQNSNRKTSRHERERNEQSSDDNEGLFFERNRQKLDRRTSKYRNVTVKEEPLSDEDKASEGNRHKPERGASRYQNISIKDEPSSDENDRLPSNRNRPESSLRVSKNDALVDKANAMKDKEKPDFAVSGKLAEDTNVFNGVVIKYNEPSEARKPKRRWRLYPFKGESDLPFIPIHRQSAYLLGRTRAIADIPIDHPSCSKQHAVLQFRLVPYTRDDGTKGRRVRPYIIDLESANGTFVNNNRINPRCYVELMEKDVIKFGYSSREYVLLHEESKNDDYDDVRDSS